MICGDITEDFIQKEVLNIAEENNVQMLIATPPCQGLSTLGKNKIQRHFSRIMEST